MRSERYQIALIALGVISTALFAYFLYREIYPEYKIYQEDYVALEDFRSTYTGEPPPTFKLGVKQIVFEREDKGPAKIDRCTSCHVAVQLPHFSPTKIAYDVNGNIVRSIDGTPVQTTNEEYVWAKLDKKIAELTDSKVNEQLTQQGEAATATARENEAQKLVALKTAQVGHQTYDVTKVLAMHPLIGKETRPFEFHPLEEYGCTSCHSGNGRGLTTEKAHGPVFDGQYEVEFMGPKPEFTEKDEENDPRFAKVFNDKPGDALLFQTTPILVGHLIQSSCIQCHEQSSAALQGLADTASSLAQQRIKKVNAINEGYQNEKEAVLTLVELKGLIKQEGLQNAVASLKKKEENPVNLPKQRGYFVQQLQFLQKHSPQDHRQQQNTILQQIDRQLTGMLGSQKVVDSLESTLAHASSAQDGLDQFLTAQQDNPEATGSLFDKLKAINLEKALLKHIEATQNSLSHVANNESVATAMTSDIDWLTKNYHRGQELYLSQACYACHRIAGMTRGGVGPELTQAGNNYPWYLKESIVWPQADLRTSTMPNFVLDHVELEDLMTFLLGQKGATAAVSQTEYKRAVQEWEAGRKMPWEKPIPSSDIHDLRYGMTVFATQGCAACHRLKGFDANVGYAIEKDGKPTFDRLYQEHAWFQSLFPEELPGTSLVLALEDNAAMIDQRIVDNVRDGSILDELEEKHPEMIEALYANFRFASRAKNHEYQTAISKAKSPQEKQRAEARLKQWQERVKRVLMMYVQEYGLGRLICPRPNWSGVYRSDEWLMEHFYNPTGHAARSIMPVFPFDESKFLSLTYMLDVLGRRNRDTVRAIWDHKGFQPDQAYHLYCSACHGPYLQGNGPVATWIYPIPKNLRNAEFLRNLTRDNAIQSITHGVKGTPMPPWGESPGPKPDYDDTPVLTSDEIVKLVDWLFSSLPGAGSRGAEAIPKWQYQPQDVIEELKREGNKLKTDQKHSKEESEEGKGNQGVLAMLASTFRTRMTLPSYVRHHTFSRMYAAGWLQSDLDLLIPKEIYYASLEPQVSMKSSSETSVNDIFDVQPNPIPGEEKYVYYIKKKYYTQENLEKGENFFELNCAACHGREADGSGARASIMFDAKPRMLTNLDWIKTRDDMRLLRSIKYGVPGTAMTPWGDLTSSLQRLQLVMFIRSLSAEKEKRDALSSALYGAFGQNVSAVEGLRIKEYPALIDLQNEYTAAKAATQAFTEDSPKALKAKVASYQKQLEIQEKLQKAKARDQLLIDLKSALSKEKEIYQGIGNDMIASEAEEAIWSRFLEMVSLNQKRFVFEDGKLLAPNHEESDKKLQTLIEEITAILQKQEQQINQEIGITQGKFPSQQREEELKSLQANLSSIGKMKNKLLSGIHATDSLHEQEKLLLKHIESH